VAALALIVASALHEKHAALTAALINARKQETARTKDHAGETVSAKEVVVRDNLASVSSVVISCSKLSRKLTFANCLRRTTWRQI